MRKGGSTSAPDKVWCAIGRKTCWPMATPSCTSMARTFPVRARHVTDRAELLASRDAVKAKYGRDVPMSQPGQPPTPPEQATFELVPAAQTS
jgi:hypothetical protein